MGKEYSRGEKLAKILKIMIALSKRPYTRAELTERFGLTTRALSRAFRVIEEAVPLQREPVGIGATLRYWVDANWYKRYS